MKFYILIIISCFFLVGCFNFEVDQADKDQKNFVTSNQNDFLKVEFIQVTNSTYDEGFFVELLITQLEEKALLEEDIWFNPISNVTGSNKIQYNSKYMHIYKTEDKTQLIQKELFEPTLYNNTSSLSFSYSFSQKYSLDDIAFRGASNENNLLTNDFFTVEHLKIRDEKLQFILTPDQRITELKENLEVVLVINEEEVFPLFSNVNKLYEHGDQIVFDLTFAMNLPDKVDFNIRFQQSPIVLYTFEFDVPVIIEIEE